MTQKSSFPYQRPAPGGFSILLSQRRLLLGLILVIALLGFEMFNYSTTEYALADLLGEMRFAGIRWATILALAFCGIDFAGIARLFLPEESQESSREIWFLFGAWLLAASLNAILTWWGVSLALTSHAVSSATFVDAGVLSKAVPIFIAVMIWVTRILLISTFSSSGLRISAQVEQNGRQKVRVAKDLAVRSQPAQHQGAAAAIRAQNPATARPTRVHHTPATSQPQAPMPRPAVLSKPQPAPKPTKPRVDEPPQREKELLPEPEYISDPSFTPPHAAYHSLTAKSKDASQHARKF